MSFVRLNGRAAEFRGVRLISARAVQASYYALRFAGESHNSTTSPCGARPSSLPVLCAAVHIENGVPQLAAFIFDNAEGMHGTPNARVAWRASRASSTS